MSMARQLTDDEADTVMANIHPAERAWCSASCGPMPGYEDVAFGCACHGCIYGALSWDDFAAWQEREKNREPTPYIEWVDEPVPPTLAERLEQYKRRKRG